MKSPLFKYQVGLAILGIFTLGIAIFLVVQSVGAREDNKTTKAAEAIAEDLNDYVDKNPVPATLEEAGITDVPSTIKYTKINDSSYEFCVTYKSASGGSADATELVSEAVSGYQGGSSYDFESEYDYSSYYLYIPSTHEAGEQCQTVEPFYYQDDNSSSSDSSFSYEECDVTYTDSESYVEVTAVSATSISVNDYSAVTTHTVPSDVKVFDYSCNELTTADIGTTDIVSLYTDADNTLVAIVKEY